MTDCRDILADYIGAKMGDVMGGVMCAILTTGRPHTVYIAPDGIRWRPFDMAPEPSWLPVLTWLPDGWHKRDSELRRALDASLADLCKRIGL